MNTGPPNLLTYQDILDAIGGQENHLLLGNGFNYGLGVSTGYAEIFQKMMDDHKEIYRDAIGLVDESNNDLETSICFSRISRISLR